MLEATGDWSRAFRAFEHQRKPNTDAIAAMALENYVEMRDTVRDPKFLLRKELAFELERRYPDRFIPRYSMVMFHHEIPYSVAYQRGRIQAGILERSTERVTTLPEVDLQRADAEIRAVLPPLDVALAADQERAPLRA